MPFGFRAPKDFVWSLFVPDEDYSRNALLSEFLYSSMMQPATSQ
jgi:hypothetical protein